MARRSPILGYNHNIGYRGLVFHVQTEDSGIHNPHIFTHLFHGGVIITTRRLDYDAEAADDVVKSLMQAQHKAVLKGLRRGEFDDKIDAYLGTNPDLKPRRETPADDQAPEDTPPVPGSAAKPAGAQPRPGPFRPPTPIPPAPPPVPSKPAAAAPSRAGNQPGPPSNVLVSRPPIVVDSNRKPPRPTPDNPGRTPRVAPARTVREETGDGIFDQNLISEKSLDEVILAYLSEDSEE